VNVARSHDPDAKIDPVARPNQSTRYRTKAIGLLIQTNPHSNIAQEGKAAK